MGSSCPVVTKQDEHQKTYHCFLAPRLPNNEMLCFSTPTTAHSAPSEAANSLTVKRRIRRIRSSIKDLLPEPLACLFALVAVSLAARQQRNSVVHYSKIISWFPDIS